LITFIITLARDLTQINATTWVCGEKDDTTPSLKKAIELYNKLDREGEKVFITVTAKESPYEGNTIMCGKMREYLIEQKIPDHAILVKKARSWNTYGEMEAAYEAIADYCQKNQLEASQIIISTRWYHTIRAWLIGLYVRRIQKITTIQTVAPTCSLTKWHELPMVLAHEAIGILIIPFYR